MAHANKNRNLRAVEGMVEHNLLVGRTPSAELRNNEYYRSDGMPREDLYAGFSGTNFVKGDPADVLPAHLLENGGKKPRNEQMDNFASLVKDAIN